MTVLIIVIAAIILAAGAFLIFKSAKNMAEKPDDSSQQNTSTPTETGKGTPESEFEQIMGMLLKLNILIRTDPELEPAILNSIELIIDDLKATIPPMMEKYPGETLTYELKKIGSAHLYNNVKEFLDLSEESRKNQISVFKNTLTSLNEVSNRARTIAEKNETQEFKTMATFLKTKFQTDLGS
jgi:hypothetical protein